MTEADAGVLVTDQHRKTLRFTNVDRFDVTGGFLYLYRGEEVVGVFSSNAWESVVKYGLGEEVRSGRGGLVV